MLNLLGSNKPLLESDVIDRVLCFYKKNAKGLGRLLSTGWLCVFPSFRR